MKEEKSCGAIVVKDGQVLIIKQNRGFYGFPKGHMEVNETEQETAIREVKEETNIDIVINSKYRYETNYIVDNYIHKTVVLFLAEPISNNIICDDKEVAETLWLPIDEAIDKLTYHNLKEILIKAKENL